MSKGVCYPESFFSSGCRIQLTSASSCQIDTGEMKYLGEEYGPNSRCLLWVATTSSGRTYPRPKCQKVRCNNNGTLTIFYNSTLNLLCEFSDQRIRVDPESYLLYCPDINDFCSEYQAKCPNDCNSNGICLEGSKCSCFDGFTGSDCSTPRATNIFRFAQLANKNRVTPSPDIVPQHLQQEQPQSSEKPSTSSIFVTIASIGMTFALALFV